MERERKIDFKIQGAKLPTRMQRKSERESRERASKKE